MSAESTNPFWDYSLDVWRRPGVEACCLALQDTCGLDVNLVLYAGWLASQQRRLSEEHLARVEHEAGQWRLRVVQPLRELRRQLRDFDAASELREQLQTLELQAERRQQDAMWRCYHDATDLSVGAGALRHNLQRVAACAGANPDRCRNLVDELESTLAE